MSINKPQLSSLVPSQVPEFVREDYDAFVAFLQAYYEFTRQNYDVNLLKLRDIDDTLDQFVEFFKKEYAIDVPKLNINDRFLVKHLKDYYLTKGSAVSFDLLLTLIFGKNISIDYPSKQMLRASDGKWNQDVSFFLKVNAGNPAAIVGRLVDVVTNQKVIQIQVNSYKAVEIEVNGTKQVLEDTYEFFIDRRFFGQINVGDRVRYANIFDAIILPTTSKIRINRSGKYFKVGELYNIVNGAGNGSILKITSVNITGGVVNAEFVKFGVNYTTDFSATLIPNGIISETTAGGTSLDISGTINDLTITFGETTNGFTEQGYVNTSDYNSKIAGESGTGDAFDGSYAGVIIREFYNDNKAPEFDPDIPCLVNVTLGPLTKYPGYYTNNDGFLSDAIYIQDSHYYQAFSYVLRIDERLENYKTMAKTLIHPAGMALFGEYDIRNELVLSETLDVMLKYLVLSYQDNFLAQAEINKKDVVKATGSAYLYDGVTLDTNVATLIDNDIHKKDFGKTLNALSYNYNGLLDNNTLTMVDNDISAKNFDKALNHTTYNWDGLLDNNILLMVDNQINQKDIEKPLQNHLLYDNLTQDDNTVSPLEVINAKDFVKLLNYGHALHDGVIVDNENFTPTDFGGYSSILNKPLGSQLDFDGSLEDTKVTPVELINAKDFGKLIDSTYLNDGTTLDDNHVLLIDNEISEKGITKPLQNHLLFGGLIQDSNLVTPTEIINAKDFIKSLISGHYINDGTTSDSESVTLLDVGGYSSILNKPLGSQLDFDGSLEDTKVVPQDSSYLLTGKLVDETYLNDGTTLDDNHVLLIDNDISEKQFGKSVANTVLNDGITLDNNSVLMTHTDTDLTRVFSKSLILGHLIYDNITVDSESAEIVDDYAIELAKYIDDPLNDVATPQGSGGSFWLNPYSDPAYFQNDSGDYMEGKIATFTG